MVLHPGYSKEEAGRAPAGARDAKQLKKIVYAHYQSGLHCAEAISKTLLETYAGKAHPQVIKAASAFGGGIDGSTEELCGAFTGGVIALGSLLGRQTGGDDLRDCGALIKAFKSRFLNQFGSLNCRDILDGFSEQETPLGCPKLTAEAALILADLLDDFEGKKAVRLDAYPSQPRYKVELGKCPFVSSPPGMDGKPESRQ
ncbi:MAG: C-GCAxxG-C-C family protein [Pseudomonadota bacterium]